MKAREKADSIVTLLGFPDWLPNGAELDKYFEGVILHILTNYKDYVHFVVNNLGFKIALKKSKKRSKLSQNLPKKGPKCEPLLGIFWNFLEFFGIFWILLNFLEIFGIFWNFLESFGIFWNFL